MKREDYRVVVETKGNGEQQYYIQYKCFKIFGYQFWRTHYFDITCQGNTFNNVPVICYFDNKITKHILIGTYERETDSSFRVAFPPKIRPFKEQYETMLKIINDNQGSSRSGELIEVINFETFVDLFKGFEDKVLYFEWVNVNNITNFKPTTPLVVAIEKMNAELNDYPIVDEESNLTYSPSSVIRPKPVRSLKC